MVLRQKFRQKAVEERPNKDIGYPELRLEGV